MFKLNIPVAFIVFNRPDTTIRVFEKIREAKPPKLYIIADAARANKEGEEEKVQETRRLIEEGIDWDCEVHKNYAESNMGCKNRVYTGITWALENEEKIIILEDDVVPNMDFFRFQQEMLDHYQDNPKVMMVSGTNLMKKIAINSQYTFSCFSSIWGWGTWARAWADYDPDIKMWPEVKKKGLFKSVTASGLGYMFLKRDMESVYSHSKDTWDLQWDFCRHIHRGLGVVPAVNMIENIGFDREDAAHTHGKSDEDFTYGEMTFPIEFNVDVKRDAQYDSAYIKKYYGVRKIYKFIGKKISGK